MPSARPRIWPAVTVAILVLQVSWVSGLPLTLVALGLDGALGSSTLERWVLDDTPLAFVTSAICAELVLIGALLFVASRSREPAVDRLALGPSRLSAWTLPAVLAGSIVAGSIGATLGDWAFEEESALSAYYRDMTASSLPLPLLLLVMAVLPALSEELFFRGYVQSRLLRRWPAWLAVLFSSASFAVAHGDPSYALAVLPIGLWLGWVAHLAASIRLTVATHFLGNAVITLANRALEEDETYVETGIEAITGPAVLDLLVQVGTLLVIAGFLHWRRRPEPLTMELVVPGPPA